MNKIILSSLLMSFTCFGETDTSLLSQCNLPHNDPIIVFTAPWCSACQEFKADLKDANIHYYEVDAEASDANMASMDCVGGEYYPYIVVSGKVVDYEDSDALDRALKPFAHH